MVMAAELSARAGMMSAADVQRLRSLILRAGLPVTGPSLPVERYLELMAIDKKVSAGRLRLVLLRGIGDAVVTADFDAAALDATLAAACAG